MANTRLSMRRIRKVLRLHFEQHRIRRHGRKSTIVTSQLPTDHWHEAIGDATLVDAILDCLVFSAHILKSSGESQRRKRNKLTNSEVSA